MTTMNEQKQNHPRRDFASVPTHTLKLTVSLDTSSVS